ncbi:hypothetical protein [Falsiroseomonas sp.]|uniref:hypothetical protein n=1 Tax=Falsiroseomonas sp. TaxID=2870721 RepID=UPI003F7169C9
MGVPRERHCPACISERDPDADLGSRSAPIYSTGRLTATAMTQPDVYRMIGRRAEAAGVATHIGCHSWRVRGITAYLENGGLLERAKAMAEQASARTIKLRDRRGEQVSLDRVERIVL